jgi:hypothetical protein
MVQKGFERADALAGFAPDRLVGPLREVWR